MNKTAEGTAVLFYRQESVRKAIEFKQNAKRQNVN